MATMNQVGVGLSGSSGSGSFAGTTSPTFVTPVLGTPSSGVLSSCTGYAQSALTGLGTGVSTALGVAVTGSGAIALANGPTFVTSTVTTPSITFSTTSGVIGTTTNNDAAAGSVGQFISSIITSGSPVSCANATTQNLTTISLTAGDWDVWGNINFACSGVTTSLIGWLSSTSATFPASETVSQVASNTDLGSGLNWGFAVPQLRYSLNGTTTIYITSFTSFSTGAVTMSGGIYARRVR